MYVLENVVQPYAWGSRRAIAELLGKPHPTDRPEAELWMGAHPAAPSRVRRGPTPVPLSEAIAGDPDGWLGANNVARFGPRLPFLFKVLAADEPLSLQAHPNPEQARRGFAEEDAAGVPRDAAARNYKDASAKPEVLCALGPFEALFGFRASAETMRLLVALDVPALRPCLANLASSPGPEGIARAFDGLMVLPGDERRPLVAAVATACRRVIDGGADFAKECAWGVRLARQYPEDVGVVVALMMNLLELKSGEALYVPAGTLHAYLGGVGVELMGSSDNVLRGGLTPKHVDRSELLRVLRFDNELPRTVPCRYDGVEQIYTTPAAEFRLSKIALDGAGRWTCARRWGPEILLCIDGEVQVQGHDAARATVHRGSSLFLTASSGAYDVTGYGVVYRATVGEVA